ncbi:MarR family 2-MHQ and catechol resistance regulon transcriptional repressor [Elusimicrobium posterum]|uniref:MarR family winged helix-turn-helix transcriptional regulator n=1 Tax=Elusimicrobium posterum TaxID=3116653 RepID=UPI003C73D464
MNNKTLADLGINKKNNRGYEELAYLIAVVYNITVAQLETMLREYKLSLAKFNILMILKYKGGDIGLSQTDITKSLIVSDGNITGVLDRLQKDQLVIRAAHPTDRRINLVRITLKGSDLVEAIWPRYEEIIKSKMKSVNTAEQKKVLAVFYKLAGALLKEEK